MNFVFIFRPERLGDRDRKAGAQAQAQADHQKVHGTGRADGCKAFRAEKAADDGSIHKTVKLLEQDTEQQRESKGNDQFQRSTFSQVTRQSTGHKRKPLSAARFGRI